MLIDRDVVEFLKRGRWFGGLPAALQELILGRVVRRSYRKGQYIVREGEIARAMHVVLAGRVRVTRKVGNEPEEVVIWVGEPGFWFGDYAVFARTPSIGSIIAETDVTTLSLSTTAFERIVRDEPEYFRCFAALLFGRYADLFRYLAESHGLHTEDWLRTRLVDLAATMRRDNPSVDAGVITISQADLATMMGMSRQTMNTMLRQLQARGIVELRTRSIRVLG
jgi:CRP-like cAMP-binding protein